MKSEKTQVAASWLDGFAVSASALCMVHCIGLPLLFVFLPVIAHRIDPGEGFHVVVLALAVPTSAYALIEGWRRHRAAGPLMAGLVGLIALGCGVLLAGQERAETIVTLAGSLLLASAHIVNWRRRHRAGHCAVS